MPHVHLPPHPISAEHLEDVANDLLRRCHAGDTDVLTALTQRGSADWPAAEVTLDDVRSLMAREYGVVSWERLLQGGRMVAAIRANDIDAVGAMISAHPSLLTEHAHGFDSNWGPPMSYASNLGLDAMVAMLADLGAQDYQHALGRACLRGQLDTARLLLQRGAKVEPNMVMGCCETQSAEGLKLLLDLGAQLAGPDGDTTEPVALLINTYCRNPAGKHRCLEYAAELGFNFPDTPVMAFHRGRIDLLKQHLDQDPRLPHRRFTLQDIYPWGEHDGLHGTSLAGTTLLHMCADFDEMKIAQWLIDHGADVNARVQIDAEGFGGHTPLFNVVVSQANINGRQNDGAMAKLMLQHGADSTVRASIRKQLRFWHDESMHHYRDVTAYEYGRAFHAQRFCNPVVQSLLEDAATNGD